MPVTALSVGLAQLEPRALETARGALRGPGALILRSSVDLGAVEAAHAAVVTALHGLDLEVLGTRGVQVGDKRFMLSVALDPPFDRPALFASPPLMSIARDMLGPALVINSIAIVVSMPGAAAQGIHVDHEPLFPRDAAASAGAPTYAMTGIVPLVDLSASTGSTEVWPLADATAARGSATSESTVLGLAAGDAAFIDYRVRHGGTANPGTSARPILYIVYSRPWFRDSENFGEMPALRVSPAHLERMPAEYRALFAVAAAGHLA